MKRGREYHGYWEEFNVEKWERVSNINFPAYYIEAVGKNIKWGKKDQDLKKWGWGKISRFRGIYTTLHTLLAVSKVVLSLALSGSTLST